MDNNKPITEHGLFWLQENEQRKLWGTLYVNEVSGSTLETFGSLIDPFEGSLHTIVGQTRSGREWVTLIDCFPTNTRNWGWSGDGQLDWSRQTYLVNGVLEGIGFERGEEIAFEQATLSISSLPKWANPNIVKLDYAKSTARHIRVNISIEDRADETTRVSFLGEEVQVSVRFQPKEESRLWGVITKYLIEDDCTLTMERPDGSKMTLKNILSVTKAIQDLLSICCNETPIVTSFSAHLENGSSRPAKIHARMRGNNAATREGHPYPALGLGDLGGIGGVAQWFKVVDRYGPAVTLLTSNWYNEKAYNEDKFSRMYTAVEGLLARKRNRTKAKITAAETGKVCRGLYTRFYKPH